jgi:hypothetical protein
LSTILWAKVFYKNNELEEKRGEEKKRKKK